MSRRIPYIVYVVSEIHKSMAFEWLATELQKHYNITFILLNPGGSPLEDHLLQARIEVKRLKFSSKKDYPRIFASLCFFFLKRRPDVVHAHLLDAQLLALTAAWLTGIKKRIYTRHTSDYHHVYFRRGIRYDRWSNFLATHIVSISVATDATLLKLENVRKDKVRKIHHGFHLSTFTQSDKEKIETVRSRWQIPDGHPRIGVIARHVEWKGVQFVVPAFEKLLKEHRAAVLILANSIGPYHAKLLAQLDAIPRKNYVLIPFEEDIVSLYALFDVYVHVPVNATCEAFGQTFVEALAARIPSVFTKSGVAAEFIEHKENAWVVDFCDSDQIFYGLVSLLGEPALQEKLRDGGERSVRQLFSFQKMFDKLRKLYEE